MTSFDNSTYYYPEYMDNVFTDCLVITDLNFKKFDIAFSSSGLTETVLHLLIITNSTLLSKLISSSVSSLHFFDQ